MVRWLLLVSLMPATALPQSFDVRSAGSRPAEPAVLALVHEYAQHLTGWTSIADRDKKRRPLVTRNGLIRPRMSASYQGANRGTDTVEYPRKVSGPAVQCRTQRSRRTNHSHGDLGRDADHARQGA